MRGRRIHERQVSSVMFSMTMLGRCRSWNVLMPTSLSANCSSMYTFIPCTIDTTAIRNVTPISTPTREKKLLSFCAQMARSAMRTASISCISGGAFLRRPVRFHPSVTQGDDPLGARRDVRLVRHHDHRLSLGMQLAEDRHDLGARGAVEVAGGLVRQQDAGPVHQRPGDGHALALPARELVGAVVHPVPESHPGQRRLRPLAALGG